jgi:hypothetical protein
MISSYVNYVVIVITSKVENWIDCHLGNVTLPATTQASVQIPKPLPKQTVTQKPMPLTLNKKGKG